ncbi:hypothetical protein [Gorillibacterium timonense]|uniref:hypothetical protein n=1 Tax=Gorillibacterium timonense TaxID=1689269 RepID=UPI00071DD89B|nr:hypothetical protein [Gorillibacterium timonense]
MFLYLELAEWEVIMSQEQSDYRGIPILKTEFTLAFIQPYLNQFGVRGTNTLAVLEKVPWKEGQWWPRILYFPKGFDEDVETLGKTIPYESFFYVYYRTFHCFDCGLDLDAFCFDRDAYVFHDAELEAAHQTLRFKNECPRCKGDMRSPGLIEIIKTTALGSCLPTLKSLR